MHVMEGRKYRLLCEKLREVEVDVETEDGSDTQFVVLEEATLVWQSERETQSDISRTARKLPPQEFQTEMVVPFGLLRVGAYYEFRELPEERMAGDLPSPSEVPA